MKRGLLAATAIWLCLLAFCSLAAAEVFTGWVIPEVLNVRSGPGTDRNKMGTVRRGQKVLVTAFVDGWCYAKLPDGRRGYLREKHIQFSAAEGRKLTVEAAARSGGSSSAGGTATGPDHPAWIKADEARVRAGPGTNHKVYGTRKEGTKVYVVGRQGDWAKVKTPGGYGWIHSDLLTDHIPTGRELAKTTQSSVPTAGETATGPGHPAWIKVDEARVRSGPGMEHEVYGTRKEGTKVYVVARQGDWAKVKTPGGFGWIRTDLLTDHVPTGQQLARANEPSASGTSVAKAFASGDRLYLRAGPGTRYDYRAVLRKGQTLYVIGKKGDWVKVRVHGGHEGWVYDDYVKYAGGAGTPTAMPPPVIDNFPSPTRQYTGGFRLSEMPAWVDSRANVRYGPGVDDDVKAVLDRGTRVTVTDISGHWCKVRLPDGSYGWMAGYVLDYDGPGDEIMADEGGQTVEVKVGWVARPGVNLRAGPSMDHDIIGKATLSTQVVILSQTADWYKVGLHGGKEAWIHSGLIDTREQRQLRVARRGNVTGLGARPGGAYAPRTAGGTGLGSEIVNDAMNYLGHPYRHGRSGEGGAFDCSGFTSYLYRQKGIRISRSVIQQFRQGTPISRSELAPGDCVFFRNTHRSGISHVGVYIGNGEFVHASNPRSGVKVDHLSSSYYGPKYAGARRMR